MKEIFELKINYDYAHLLFKENEGKNLGQFSKSIKVIELSKDDPRYNQIPIISKRVKEEYDKGFLLGWQIKRKYSKNEINSATVFQVKIKKTFEPAGEECKTRYDESIACEICGTGRKQIGTLKLKKGTIPKQDIAKTIGGEVLVSERFAIAFKQRALVGITLEPVFFDKITSSNYFQLIAAKEFGLSKETIVGVNPFDFSESSDAVESTVSAFYPIKYDKEIYKCPKGHTIGLNLLSEAFILDNPHISEFDFFISLQKIGVKRGLLRPESLYFCSSRFREMIVNEGFTGFDFEVAHIV